MKRALKIFITEITLSALWACGGGCLKSKTAEVKKLLKRELKVGDSREKVARVLDTAGITHDYDRFQNREQATLTDVRCSPFDAISIYVNFDSQGKLTGWEAFESHTAP